MTDIAKCTNHQCPSRETCWRFIAPPSQRQGYIAGIVPQGEDRCERYWVSKRRDG